MAEDKKSSKGARKRGKVVGSKAKSGSVKPKGKQRPKPKGSRPKASPKVAKKSHKPPSPAVPNASSPARQLPSPSSRSIVRRPAAPRPSVRPGVRSSVAAPSGSSRAQMLSQRFRAARSASPAGLAAGAMVSMRPARGRPCSPCAKKRMAARAGAGMAAAGMAARRPVRPMASGVRARQMSNQAGRLPSRPMARGMQARPMMGSRRSPARSMSMGGPSSNPRMPMRQTRDNPRNASFGMRDPSIAHPYARNRLQGRQLPNYGPNPGFRDAQALRQPLHRPQVARRRRRYL